MTVPELAPGQIVAQRYTVRGQLGRTEHVATYEAVTAPSREVVLKVHDAALRERPAVMDALQRVVALENGLSDAHVVRTLEVVFDPATGSPIVVSELCSWPSLSQLVELCPLAMPDAVKVLEHLAEVLDEASSRTLLHLSLHPGNVFVGPAPQWAVRVGDFVAQATRTEAESSDRYLAPELRGEGPAPTATADVFASAVLLYFALTRRTLTPQEAVAGASHHAQGEGLAVDARVDAEIARAMALDPTARHASVRELWLAVAQAVGLGPARSVAPPAPAAAVAPAARAVPEPPPVPRPPVPSGAQAMRPRMRTQMAFPAPQAPEAAPAPEPSTEQTEIVAAPVFPPEAPTEVEPPRPEEVKAEEPPKPASVPPPPDFLAPLPPAPPSIFDTPPAPAPPPPAAPAPRVGSATVPLQSPLAAPPASPPGMGPPVLAPIVDHVESSGPVPAQPLFGAFAPSAADAEPLPVTSRRPRDCRRLVAVLAGFAVACVIGVGVAAVALHHTAAPAASIASATTASGPPSAASAAVAPQASSVAALEPPPATSASATASAAPDPSASIAAADPDVPDAAAEAAPPPAPKGTSLYVTCDPGCDEVRIDGFTIFKKDKPFLIKPGYHMLLVRKTGYGTQIHRIVTPRNKATTFHVKLSRAATTKATHHKKPCGKFLERCD